LPSNAINPRKVNGYDFQSKGLNDIVNVGGTLYAASVNQDNKIVIRKVSSTSIAGFMTTNLTASKYNDIYSGAGSVCADNESMYFSYINSDNSVSVSKINLSKGINPE